VSVFVEVAFGFDELVVDPKTECPRLGAAQADCPAWLVNHYRVPMQCVPIGNRPSRARDGAFGSNIGVATGYDPTDEPPRMIVHVQIIIGLEPMMYPQREEIQIENPTLHVGAFG